MTEQRNDDALGLLESLPDTVVSQRLWYPASLMRGMTLSVLGQDATGAYGEAAAILEGRILEADWDERAHAALGLAYAGLGRRDDAVTEARRAVDLLPLTRDAMDAPWYLLNLAAVHAHFGEVDEALDLLGTVLSVPSLYPPGIIEDHYLLIPLREEPRFQEMIERERERVF
jgi:serine/threonine-protein kinase